MLSPAPHVSRRLYSLLASQDLGPKININECTRRPWFRKLNFREERGLEYTRDRG